MTLSAMESDIGEVKSSLEVEALKRKERLAALRRKAAAVSSGSEEQTANELPSPRFRSYLPENEELKEKVLPPAKPVDVESEIQDQLVDTTNVIEDLDFKKLVPKKADWDLKRDIEKKLDRLERRTNKAIAELIRERLKNTENDLVTNVNLGVETTQKYDDDDEDKNLD